LRIANQLKAIIIKVLWICNPEFAICNPILSRALSWTEIRSEVAGSVQDRQVHPGNRVEPGQTLLSIRPTYVWIAANDKETQIHDIRIGMPVDIYDASIASRRSGAPHEIPRWAWTSRHDMGNL
jgi:hypothetical protein